jgi:hypothetical protein
MFSVMTLECVHYLGGGRSIRGAIMLPRGIGVATLARDVDAFLDGVTAK